MTMHRATRVDRILPELFAELADARTPAYLEAAIERASSRPQRPSWTFPGRWLPMDITTRTAPVAWMPWRQLGVLALIGLLLAVALAAFVGSQQQQRPAPPFGPAANGAIALEKDGDIFVADRPGGDLRPLVAGPEDDRGPLFSPDGTRLAFVRATEPPVLMVADADGTNAVQLTREPLDTGPWSFAPDGRSLMTAARIDGAWRVVIRPVDPGAALTVLDIRLPDASWERVESGGPSFRPTNPQEILVVAQPEPGGPSGLYVYDLATGGTRTIVEPADDLYLQEVAWLPDGEHIIYTLGFEAHIVAADGSGDRIFLRADRLSRLSNDGTRIVIDVAEVDLPGDDSHQRSVVVPFDGEGEPVELACGLGMKIECAWSWIWSPDDSMLIGTVPHETSSTYLQADPDTGQVTELDWLDVGTPAWQRVGP
jgi:Tol biopolymer transport system component